VEHRRAEADESRRNQQAGEAAGEREAQQSHQREAHAGHERVRLGVVIGVQTDHRLQQGRRELEGEGDETDLAEIEVKAGLQHRVHGRQQRLHHVVQQVAEADREQHGDGGGHRGKVAGEVVGRGLLSHPERSEGALPKLMAPSLRVTAGPTTHDPNS
jgi:hypothetical protein